MYRLEKRNHPRNRFRKNSLRRQEANHQIPIARKIKEVPRMHVNIPRSNQLNSQLLIRPRNRHAQNRIPPTLKLQPRTSRLPSKPPIQLSKIPPHPPHQPPLKLTPQLKKRTQSKLHRRIQRKKSIRNHLQPLNRHPFQIRRPRNRQPSHLHLRQSTNLRYPAQSKSKRRQIPSKSSKALAAQRKIQKHLISNNPKRSPRANLIQARDLRHLAKMPGRIIRVNHNHPASPRSNRPLQLMKINLPTMVVNQRIPNQLHIRQFRQIIKQRIRRRRNQNLVPNIAKQPQNKRVSLASRGSQKKFANPNAIPPRSVIIRNRNPRDLKPPSV